MHEMTLLSSVVRIIQEEMANNGLVKLHRVVLKSGTLAGLAPESMRLAWEVLTQAGPTADPLRGAELCVEHVPVLLCCGGCGREFAPEEQAVFAACPACGAQLGHRVLAGREVYIESIEGEDGSGTGDENAGRAGGSAIAPAP